MKNHGKSHREYVKPIQSGYNVENKKKEPDCTKLNFFTILELITDAFKDCEIGEYLTIKKSKLDIISAYTLKNKLCGNITSPFTEQLIHCIDSGYKYKGEIINLKGKIHIKLDENS
ncbi:MAG: hypothetical protein R2794_05140 [Chitinophagales bacterium]